MLFACPPEGFRVKINENLKPRIKSFAERWERFDQTLHDSLGRLSKTGHREGTRVKDEPGAVFVWETQFQNGPTELRLMLLYRCRGDTLTLFSVEVRGA